GLGWTKFRLDAGNNLLAIKTFSATPRSEWRWSQLDNLAWTFGTDSRLFLTKADVLLPNDYAPGGVFNPLAAADEVSVNVLRFNFDLGFYSTMAWSPKNSKWTFTPGVRFDYFNATKDAFVDPRMAVAYDIDSSFRLRAQGGLYHQPPEPRETNDDVGNPNLSTPSAWHLSFIGDKDFRGGSTTGFSVSSGPFFRWFDDLVTRSNAFVVKNGELVPEFYNSSTKGFAYGGEASIKYVSSKYELALAYMILNSTRTEPGIGEYQSPFDQTHNLNVIAGVNLGNNWRVSSRVRYVTGNPYTPVVSSTFDADNGVYIPNRGAFYSERVGGFFQWDIRLDKKWIYNRWILSLYLDIQNATNRKNPESIEYSYDYQQLVTTNGLPILPALGLKGEF
ncbi:MAG: TonB-dependent receptor, partial [Bdellovibrionales bacterium]|nr:TonB-dependent receptor [Bdellovibrionales bacterium]